MSERTPQDVLREHAAWALAATRITKDHGQLCPVWTQRMKRSEKPWQEAIAGCNCWIIKEARTTVRILEERGWRLDKAIAEAPDSPPYDLQAVVKDVIWELRNRKPGVTDEDIAGVLERAAPDSPRDNPCAQAFDELARQDAVIDRLNAALRVASHQSHDQLGEPNEGFPVCSVCGAIQTAPDTLSEKPGLDVAERIANFLPVPPQVSGNENRELGWAMARTQLIAAIRARPRSGSTDSEGR